VSRRTGELCDVSNHETPSNQVLSQAEKPFPLMRFAPVFGPFRAG
jgi:hypothetical protein